MKFSILSKNTARRKKKMKIRDGFVSNSSTTSFVILGARVESSQFYKMFNLESFNQKMIDEIFQYSDDKPTLEEFRAKDLDEWDYIDFSEFGEYLEGLDVYSGYDSEEYFIGIDPSPDEGKTKGEDILVRMKRTADKIQDIHNIVNNSKHLTEKGKKAILSKLDWHLEAWRDG